MNLKNLFRRKEDVPPTAQVTTSGSREISEADYLRLCSSDDYHGDQLTRFRVARALLYAESNEIAMSEPGVLMLALAIQMTGKPANIIEFGGGTGYHSTTLRRILPGSIARYVVVETAEQVAAAIGVVKDAEFRDNIPDEKFDIVFSSGAFQHTQSPFGFLTRLVALNAPILVFARNAFSDRQVYFEQKSSIRDHGAGTAPSDFADMMTTLYVQTLSERKFLETIPAHYSRVARIQNNSGIVEGCDAYGFDYLFRASRDDRGT